MTTGDLLLLPRKRRFDSLFARLLLAQAIVVTCATALFALLLFAERSVVLAEPYAEILAPELAKSVVGAQPRAFPRHFERRAELAPGVGSHITNMPGMRALRQRLAQRGVQVDEVVLQKTGDEFRLWLHVQSAQGSAEWVGISGLSILPGWSMRLSLGMLALLLLVATLSWAFARHISRPLERLRAAIQSQAPGLHAEVARLRDRPSEGSAEVIALAASFADLQMRIQRYERERTVLLGGVSHDLRSPLGRIRLAAEMLPETEDNAEGVHAIVRNVEKADRLVGSFLDFVRAGQLALKETVDLAAQARGAAAAFAHLGDPPSVVAPAVLRYGPASALLIERLITNLIDNAFKHGRAPVIVTVAAHAGGARIDVDDQGDGMSPNTAIRLQEAFARGDSSRVVPGTGLGLAIVRQVAARLGGELSFERLNGGQRVRVTLPPRG